MLAGALMTASGSSAGSDHKLKLSLRVHGHREQTGSVHVWAVAGIAR